MTQVSDWIGGKCYADALQVWFPAHWMPYVVQQLQKKEDDYRLEHPSWFDQPGVPEKLQKSWQEARESRETKFKFGTYEKSMVEMISSALRADWFQPQVQDYLEMLPNLKAGVIVGVFKTKGATPWAAVRAEKLQVYMFLPNKQPMEEWFADVNGLPAVWPDLSMIGSGYSSPVSGSHMWGTISPNWGLLHKHLMATGPGYYTVAQRQDSLFDNRSNRSGDDLKDDVCPNTAVEAWQFWNAQKQGFTLLQQPGPVVVFPDQATALDPMFQQISREEELLSLQYRSRGSKETRARGTKRRKQDAEASG